MNTNLGHIPIEIYVDYISEQTNQEWTIEHLMYLSVFRIIEDKTYIGDGSNTGEMGWGCDYQYGIWTGEAKGAGVDFGYRKGKGFAYDRGHGMINYHEYT